MRIRKERQDSNIRIGLLESSISRTIADALSSDLEYTYLEVVTALGNVQIQWLEGCRRAYEQPVLEEGVGDEQK